MKRLANLVKPATLLTLASTILGVGFNSTAIAKPTLSQTENNFSIAQPTVQVAQVTCSVTSKVPYYASVDAGIKPAGYLNAGDQISFNGPNNGPKTVTGSDGLTYIGINQPQVGYIPVTFNGTNTLSNDCNFSVNGSNSSNGSSSSSSSTVNSSSSTVNSSSVIIRKVGVNPAPIPQNNFPIAQQTTFQPPRSSCRMINTNAVTGSLPYYTSVGANQSPAGFVKSTDVINLDGYKTVTGTDGLTYIAINQPQTGYIPTTINGANTLNYCNGYSASTSSSTPRRVRALW